MDSFLYTLELISNFLIANVFGKIILGVVTSFCFIFILLYTLRPKVKISPSICYIKMKPENKYFYVFKIVNSSWFYTFDVHINLVKKEPYLVNKGKKINHRIVPIKTSTNYKNHLPKSKRKEGYGDHAYLIRTEHDIAKDINDEDVTVKLTISSKHGLTNLTRVVTHEYLSTNNIFKDKEFKFGSCLDVV